MLVAEKKHHIKTHIYGQGAEYVVDILKRAIPDLEVYSDKEVNDPDEELIEISTSKWFYEMSEEMIWNEECS